MNPRSPFWSIQKDRRRTNDSILSKSPKPKSITVTPADGETATHWDTDSVDPLRGDHPHRLEPRSVCRTGSQAAESQLAEPASAERSRDPDAVLRLAGRRWGQGYPSLSTT